MYSYKKSNGFFRIERGAMSENYCWLFVENVPLLFDKERVQRQLKVETWLDLIQLLKEIRSEERQSMNYVV